ncbi:MAG: Superkiller protein 3 [Alyxoria varia]|nr:MAG: Superkiller protein 3 [Alyxoria varia]
MASVKAALKGAKSALEAQNYSEAALQARVVLEADDRNYFAYVSLSIESIFIPLTDSRRHIFLGRALEKQGKLDEAILSYEAASKIKPGDELAWKGLCNAYESQGSRGVSKHNNVALDFAKVYAEKEDLHQCQSIIDKLVAFAKENGTRSEYKQALQTLLPSSPIFPFLEGRIQPPAYTYKTVADITLADEKERINKEIGERRTRLGARIDQVKSDVIREVFNQSELENLYENVIDWTNDDDERRLYEERILQHAYDHLVALPMDGKSGKRNRVLKLAHDMVLIQHPFQLAWDIDIEWTDFNDVDELDRNVLLQYATNFPETGLSKIIKGYFGLASRDEPEVHGKAESRGSGGEVEDLSAEEKVLMISEGVEEAQESVFARRVAAQHYLQIEDYELCSEISRKALKRLKSQKQKSGLRLEHNTDAINCNLASALIYYQSPKNHPEAHAIFDDILKRKPTITEALLGVGLIHEERENFDRAASFLNQALLKAPDNLRVASEAAWCQALTGDLENGLEKLRSCLSSITADKKRQRLDLKALVSYRIGRCLWDLNPDKKSRKERQGPYSYFLAAVKAAPSFAPAYTSLGLYYHDCSKDTKRARQCFQKAFELSASEITAAEYLARGFAKDREWDIVEVIAQRAIDSGAVKPAPGSARKAVSWPFAAMGVVQMNKQEYPRSVSSFQAALRISPNDYHCWVSLGESYLSSGRYNAASKTLEHASSLFQGDEQDGDPWFAQYMYANVQRELANYEEAISGYRRVLETRPNEFGVSIALLQALVEDAWQCIELGFLSQAAESARDSIVSAQSMSLEHRHTMNFWKAIGDALAIYCWVPRLLKDFPLSSVQTIMREYEPRTSSKTLEDLDGVLLETLLKKGVTEECVTLNTCLEAAILAGKNAINAAYEDPHAQSVAWYNLGWIEHQAKPFATNTVHNSSVGSSFANCPKASLRCFKRAIELEASNTDFWNALGVVTIELNPRVAQHAFIRALNLNESNAQTWANLGALYLHQRDYELAHQAFTRAQSTDPNNVYAWIGEGLVAMELGNTREALLHFSHAFEISDAADVPAKALFVASTFDDYIANASGPLEDIGSLITHIFALQQLLTQAVDAVAWQQLLALLQERVGNYAAAVELLTVVCEITEARYEDTESPLILGNFLKSKCAIARNQLVSGDYAEACENAETALSLSEDMEAGSLSSEQRSRARLSANLTAGLACYYQADMDAAIPMFRAALEESEEDPEALILLSKVLWAKAGTVEREVAKEQLSGCVETHPEHVGAMTVLSVISMLEGDQETLDAVLSDLQDLRASHKPGSGEHEMIEDLVSAIAGISAAVAGDAEETVGSDEVKRSIMLFPSRSSGWSKLVEESSDAGASRMSVKAAMGEVPPVGSMGSEELSMAFANVSNVAEVHRAIMLCPWRKEGWESLKACIS